MEKKLEKHAFTSLQLANSVLESSFANKQDINLLKLMKLSYITIGYCLYFDFDPVKEDIQAWKYGPVLPSLWHSFKEYGLTQNISDFALDFDWEKEKTVVPSIDINKNETTKTISAIIYHVVDKYRDFSGWELVSKTHQEFTPWKTVYQENKKGLEISKKEIKEYYQQNMSIKFI